MSDSPPEVEISDLLVDDEIPGDSNEEDPDGIGLLLSGAAPCMTLLSGAMQCFLEEDIDFDVISTAGVGALVGLMSVAPMGTTPMKALGALPDLFVSDMWYRMAPYNPKVFGKFGPFSDPIRKFAKRFHFDVTPRKPGVRRLFNDWVDYSANILSPTTYTRRAPAVMTQFDIAEELIDFKKLPHVVKPKVYANMFDLSDRRLEAYDQADLDIDYYKASQALMFLYPPQQIGTQVCSTGATHDPTGLQKIWISHANDLDIVIALDTTPAATWRQPRNVYDAFQLMLMNPVKALEQFIFEIYAVTEHALNLIGGPERLPKLYRVPFDVPKGHLPRMYDWTLSNALKLERIGREGCEPFTEALKQYLQGDDGPLEAYRYHTHLAKFSYHEELLRLIEFFPVTEPEELFKNSNDE